MEKFDNEELSMLTNVVWFTEAVNWVAYREWNEKSTGAQHLYEFTSDSSDEDNQHWGRIEFAEEILIEAVISGKVRLLGKKCPVRWDDDEWDFNFRDDTEENYSIVPKELMSDWQGLADLTDTLHISDVEFAENVAFVDVLAFAEDVKSQWPKNIKKEAKEVATSTPLPSAHIKDSDLKPRRGRPPKYNWENFFRHIVQIANTPDGLPEKQAELERLMATWCLTAWGGEPTESMIRKKISPLYKKANKTR